MSFFTRFIYFSFIVKLVFYECSTYGAWWQGLCDLLQAPVTNSELLLTVSLTVNIYLEFKLN